MRERPDSLHDYYAHQAVLPTYGAFASPADLDEHERRRRRLFTDKLCLPPRLFAGARLLEFGPDAGENSLVFARWGATCTLVEPHLRAHGTIREGFERFGLADRLASVEACDLESYSVPASEAERFDVVDAEGFVYSIQPSSIWIEKLRQVLRDEGFAVLFYLELFGSLLELTWKVVHARFRSLTGFGAVESATALFAAKWSSIPHKRTMESWVMDVLENPFVRSAYALEAADLCRQLGAAGFRHYSSWPRYDGGLDVHWFKHELRPEEELEHQLDFVARSRVSYMLGRKHFLRDLDAVPESELRGLVADVDALIEEFDDERAQRCRHRLDALAALIASDADIAREADTRLSLETLEMLQRLLATLAAGDAAAIADFCNSDRAFLAGWGMPSHFAVFRKAP